MRTVAEYITTDLDVGFLDSIREVYPAEQYFLDVSNGSVEGYLSIKVKTYAGKAGAIRKIEDAPDSRLSIYFRRIGLRRQREELVGHSSPSETAKAKIRKRYAPKIKADAKSPSIFINCAAIERSPGRYRLSELGKRYKSVPKEPHPTRMRKTNSSSMSGLVKKIEV